MRPEEILKQNKDHIFIIKEHHNEKDVIEVVSVYHVKRLMNEYAKLKCAEQRQLCADECSAFDRGDMGYKDWMIDAPEPELL